MPRTHSKLVLAFIAIVLTAVCGLGAAATPAHATDKKPVAKPKPKPPTGLDVFVHIDDIRGESTDDKHRGEIELLHVVQGRLHVVVQTFYDADGNVAERRLHANLMDAFATSADGALRLPASGADSETRPAQPCTSDGVCPSDVWTFRFDLPHGAFTLRIATQYDADGGLADVAVLRQDGPPILG